MNQNIVHFDPNTRTQKKTNLAMAAPIDVAVLMENLKGMAEDCCQQAEEYMSKMDLVCCLADTAATQIRAAGLDPAKFITDEETAMYFAYNDLVITESDDTQEIEESIDRYNGLAFIMAGENGEEYYALTGYLVNPDGYCGVKASLFRQDATGGGVFNVQTKEWDFLTIPETFNNSHVDILGPGATDAEWDFVDFFVTVTRQSDTEVVKKAVKSNRELISLYEKTRNYMTFETAAVSKDFDGNEDICLLPMDENRMGIAARYKNGRYKVYCYLDPEEFDEGSKFAETGYFREAAGFDTADEAAGYLFKACNRFTAYPVYTIPVSKDVFVDIDQLDGEVVYTNKTGKLTEKERRAITPFVDMILAREED